MEKLAKGARLPGEGDMSIVALDAVADIGASSYSLSADVVGRLVIVKGFELDELSFGIEYAGGSLQILSFGSLFAIGGTELYLAASRSEAGWTLSGGTYEEAKI